MTSKDKAVVIDRVLNQGTHDGMFNINFGTYLFTPVESVGDDGKPEIVINPDLRVSCRLRMGEACLRELKLAVDYMLGLAEENKRKRAGEIPATASESAAQHKPN